MRMQKKFKYAIAAFAALVLSAGTISGIMPRAAAEETPPEIQPRVW